MSKADARDRNLVTGNGTPLSTLGLGAREDRYPEGVGRAAARGVNLFFLYHLGGGAWAEALRRQAAHDRGNIALATGSGSRSAVGLRRALKRYLEAFGSDHVDIFFAEYVHPGDDPESVHGADGVLAELARWKEQGTIRYVGATAHDRSISRRLAQDPRLDVLMQRYNMAHRKAADEVFPICGDNDVAVIAFTATRWGSLLRGHPDWSASPPGPLDCYRFALAHPLVDIVLASPRNDTELDEDLRLLESAPVSPDEIGRWQRYGDLVYGDGSGSFETAWP